MRSCLRHPMVGIPSPPSLVLAMARQTHPKKRRKARQIGGFLRHFRLGCGGGGGGLQPRSARLLRAPSTGGAMLATLTVSFPLPLLDLSLMPFPSFLNHFPGASTPSAGRLTAST